MQRVMVCSIARNEENRIRDWYASIKDADTIVLLDTGSTDRTVEIANELAKEHADFRVLSVPFADPAPYDLMRSMSFAQATPDDFVLWIDIDERFVSEAYDKSWVDEVRELPPEVNALNVRLVFDSAGNLSYWQQKGCRAGTHYWKYSVHEVLTPYGQSWCAQAKFWTQHVREAGKAYRDSQFALLERDLRLYPRDPRVLFYLIRQHAYNLTALAQDDDYTTDAIINRYCDVVSPLFAQLMSMQDQAHDYAAFAAIELSRAIQIVGRLAKEAVRLAMIAYTLRSDRPETAGQLGQALFYARDDLAAISFNLHCLECGTNSNFMFDESLKYKTAAVAFVVDSCIALSMTDKALFYAHKYNRTDLVERLGLNLVGTPVA